MPPQHFTTEVSAREIDKDILTSRVECEDNFAPRDGLLLRFAQYMLSKEQQEAAGVVVDRASVLFNCANAFDNVRKMELFTTRKERYLFGGEEFVEVGGDLFGYSLWFIVIREVGI